MQTMKKPTPTWKLELAAERAELATAANDRAAVRQRLKLRDRGAREAAIADAEREKARKRTERRANRERTEREKAQHRDQKRRRRERNIAAGLTGHGQPRKLRSKAAYAAKSARYTETHHTQRWARASHPPMLEPEERARDRSRCYIAENKERMTVLNRKHRQASPGKQVAKRLKFRQAYPAWLSDAHREQIDNYYHLGRAIGYHVDHIVPLSSYGVCGLHVPWNLQLLSPADNIAKGNWYEQHPAPSTASGNIAPARRRAKETVASAVAA